MANLLIWHHLDPEQSLEDYNSAIEYDITSAKIEGYGFFPAIDLPNPEPLSQQNYFQSLIKSLDRKTQTLRSDNYQETKTERWTFNNRDLLTNILFRSSTSGVIAIRSNSLREVVTHADTLKLKLSEPLEALMLTLLPNRRAFG